MAAIDKDLGPIFCSKQFCISFGVLSHGFDTGQFTSDFFPIKHGLCCLFHISWNKQRYMISNNLKKWHKPVKCTDSSVISLSREEEN